MDMNFREDTFTHCTSLYPYPIPSPFVVTSLLTLILLYDFLFSKGKSLTMAQAETCRRARLFPLVALCYCYEGLVPD